MVIPTDAEEACDKIQHPFLTQTFHESGIEDNLLNLIQALTQKNKIKLADNMRDGGRWNAFSLRAGKIQGCLLSPLPFNAARKGLASAVRENKEMKDLWIGMEEAHRCVWKI